MLSVDVFNGKLSENIRVVESDRQAKCLSNSQVDIVPDHWYYNSDTLRLTVCGKKHNIYTKKTQTSGYVSNQFNVISVAAFSASNVYI